MHLVLIETSGNQSYIFSTNKLRENVGASELTARAGTQFVMDAVREAGGPDLPASPPGALRPALRDSRCNAPAGAERRIEVVLAASGKALLLVSNDELGRRVVSSVTRRALREAPGLAVHGVVGEAFDMARVPIHRELRMAHEQFEAARSCLPGPEARFLRLPIVAECATSGLPAAAFEANGAEPGARSAAAAARLRAADAGFARMQAVAGEGFPLARSVSRIEELGCDWLGVVRADGNGLGSVFLNFDRHAPRPEGDLATANRHYVDALRKFSLGLEECTEQALRRALGALAPGARGVIPAIPLVVGGDDLTLICDGRQALDLALTFVLQFKRATQAHADVVPVLPRGITSSAGVAIVKPHFPFFAAYELADQLLRSAKQIKPLGAVDFHVLHDASGADLARMRRELTRDEGSTRLVARPYAAEEQGAPPGRSWRDLQKRVSAIQARDNEGRRVLPGGMLHDLREGLFLGRAAAESRLRLVRERYAPHLAALLSGGKLFWEHQGQFITGLLDALEAAEFCKGEP